MGCSEISVPRLDGVGKGGIGRQSSALQSAYRQVRCRAVDHTKVVEIEGGIGLWRLGTDSESTSPYTACNSMLTMLQDQKKRDLSKKELQDKVKVFPPMPGDSDDATSGTRSSEACHSSEACLPAERHDSSSWFGKKKDRK